MTHIVSRFRNHGFIVWLVHKTCVSRVQSYDPSLQLGGEATILGSSHVLRDASWFGGTR